MNVKPEELKRLSMNQKYYWTKIVCLFRKTLSFLFGYKKTSSSNDELINLRIFKELEVSKIDHCSYMLIF